MKSREPLQKKILTHLDADGKPQMVDVGTKAVTKRRALAEARITLPEELLAQARDRLETRSAEIESRKGPVFQTAILAGIMGVKKTADLIPLCHPLPLSRCSVDIRLEGRDAVIHCEAEAEAKTGVEMEALTGAAVAALTVYDMCKSFGKEMEIHSLRLLQKEGGNSDFMRR